MYRKGVRSGVGGRERGGKSRGGKREDRGRGMWCR